MPNGTGTHPARRILVREAPTSCVSSFWHVAPHKGAHVVIEALRLAALAHTRLALWGRVDDPRYERQLRASAATVPGLSLEFGGEYAPRQLVDALDGADAVVVASQVREASPIVPREALAHGVPVPRRRIGGLPDSIDDGRNGMTFEPFDPSELAEIMRRLASERGFLRALATGRTHEGPNCRR